jgi:hypothetical protein
MLLRDSGRYASAHEEFARVVRMRVRLSGPDHPEVANSMESWAESLRRSGDVNAAEGKLRESLAIKTKNSSEASWQVATTKSLLVPCLVAQRRLAEAEELLREAYPLIEQRFGPTHPRAVRTAERGVALYEAWNKPSEAAVWRVHVTKAPIRPPERQGQTSAFPVMEWMDRME